MEQKETIQIAYAIHDDSGSYFEYLSISLISVMENTKEQVQFHILCDHTLSEQVKEKLTDMCSKYGQLIQFYEITLDERISITELMHAGYCAGILFRLYLPEVLPELSKILYLDADILAYGDVSELWNMEVRGYAMGRWDPPIFGFPYQNEEIRQRATGFRESVDWNRYINSGVMLMNLSKIRKDHQLVEESIMFWKQYGMYLPDQDALNYIFGGDVDVLPVRFNMFNREYPIAERGYFYHYSYVEKPEDEDGLDEIDTLLLSYWEKTPFYHPYYNRKECVQFLRCFKNRMDLYEQLLWSGEIRKEEMLDLVYACLQRGAYEKAYEYLMKSEKLEESLQKKKEALDSDDNSSKYYFKLCFMNLLIKVFSKLDKEEELLPLLEQSFIELPKVPYMVRDIKEQYLCLYIGNEYRKREKYEEAEKYFKQGLWFGTQEKKVLSEKALEYLVKVAIKRGNVALGEQYNRMLITINNSSEAAKWNQVKLNYMREKMKRKEHALSIILPAYNAEKTIGMSIESVFTEQKLPVELIIIDDGSKDRTFEICENYARNNPHIHLYHQENSGPGAARNHGLRRAQGAYLCFMDADDCYDAKTLYAAWKRLEAGDVDVVCVGERMIPASLFEHRNQNTGYILYQNKGGETISGKEAFRRMLIGQGLDSNTYAKIYRRSILPKDLCFYEGMLGDDMPVTYRMLLSASSVYMMEEIGYEFRMDESETSISNVKFAPYFFDMVEQAKILFNKVQKEFPEYYKEAAAFYLDFVLQCVERIVRLNDRTDYQEKLKELLKELNRFQEELWSSPYISKSRKLELKLLLLSAKIAKTKQEDTNG